MVDFLVLRRGHVNRMEYAASDGHLEDTAVYAVDGQTVAQFCRWVEECVLGLVRLVLETFEHRQKVIRHSLSSPRTIYRYRPAGVVSGFVGQLWRDVDDHLRHAVKLRSDRQGFSVFADRSCACLPVLQPQPVYHGQDFGSRCPEVVLTDEQSDVLRRELAGRFGSAKVNDLRSCGRRGSGGVLVERGQPRPCQRFAVVGSVLRPRL